MKLIYVHYVGSAYDGNHQYQFLFSSDEISEVTGEDWDSFPADGNPEPPTDFVSKAVKVFVDYKFELLQDQISFSMEDGKHGLIALAWECDESYTQNEEIYNKRMYFKFGQDYSEVLEELTSHDIYVKEDNYA